jgi:phage gp29-like protein
MSIFNKLKAADKSKSEIIPGFQILKINDYTFSEYVTDIDIDPNDIREGFIDANTLTYNDIIDKLIKTDAHFLGKYQDRLSIVDKININWLPASDSPEDERICQEVKEVIEPLITNEFISHQIKSIFRRYAVSEIIWFPENSKIIPVELHNHPFRAFDFNTLHDEEAVTKLPLHLMLYNAETENLAKIPPNKAVISYAPVKFDSRVLSLSEAISPLIIAKFFAMQKFWTRFMEVYGNPPILARMDGTNEKKRNTLLSSLASLGAKGYGVINGVAEIIMIEPKGDGADKFDKFIQRCDDGIGMAITGQSGTSGNGEKSSYASMRILNGVREDIAAASVAIPQRSINHQLIKPYCLLNYNIPANRLPRVQLSLPSNLTAKADLDKKIKDLGVTFKKEYFEENYNLNPDHFEVSGNSTQQSNLDKVKAELLNEWQGL